MGDRNDEIITFTKPSRLKTSIQALTGNLFQPVVKIASTATMGAAAPIGEALAEIIDKITPQDTVEEAGWSLIYSALHRATVKSVLPFYTDDIKAAAIELETFIPTINLNQIQARRDFLDNPKSLPILKPMAEDIAKALTKLDLPEHEIDATKTRFPTAFVYALEETWHDQREALQAIKDLIISPLNIPANQERAWTRYQKRLEYEANQRLYGTKFSLTQLYQEPRAYWIEKPDKGRTRHHVVDLKAELTAWFNAPQNPPNDFRIISGGPGSGKSSFAKLFAQNLLATGNFAYLLPFQHIRRFDLEAEIAKSSVDDLTAQRSTLIEIFNLNFTEGMPLEVAMGQAPATGKPTGVISRSTKPIFAATNQGPLTKVP